MKQKLFITFFILSILLSSCGGPTQAPAPKQAATEPAALVEPAAPAVDQPLTGKPADVLNPEPSTAELAYTPTFESAPCPFELPAGQVDGETVECGYLVVPENRNDPQTRDIRLGVAIFRHPGGAAQPDPIIYLSGGPGASALELIYISFQVGVAPLFAAERDLIYFDQRGVGTSEPALDCPKALDLSLELLDLELDGQQLGKEEIFDLMLETYLACQGDLSQMADLSAYNTAASAADVNDLRLALGYDQVNLRGVSYGTRLALGVMRDYPAGLRSVVLDSVYPPDVDLYLETPANADRAFNALFESCANDEVCNDAYPDLQEVFFKTVDRLNADPASVEITNIFTGETYQTLLTGDGLMGLQFQLFYKTELLPVLPSIIYDASQDSFEMLAQLRGLFVSLASAASRGMMLSALCNEEIPFSSMEAFESVLVENPDFTGLFENSILGKLTYEACEYWEAGQAEAVENQQVVSDIPTLIMAGEFDPITPPAWGKHAAESLENGYFFEYPGVGHGASGVKGCPQDMMVAFINDPAQAPDGTCTAAMGIEFVTPTDPASAALVPLTVDEFGIRALVPQGWQQIKPEYYISPDNKVELVVVEVLDDDHEAFLNKWGASEALLETVTNDLNWSLREIVLSEKGIAGYLATAPSAAGFYMVLIISTPGNQEALYEYVFLPIVEAFTIDDTLIAAEDDSVNSIEENTGDGAAITMLPFTSEEFGLSGVIPEGWTEAAPGMYARGANASDQTVIIQKSYPNMTLVQLNEALLPQLGIDGLPESVGQYQNEDFTWDLYTVEVGVPNAGTFVVDIAQFESGGTAYMVLLQTQADDYKTLHEAVFLPAVEGLQVLE